MLHRRTLIAWPALAALAWASSVRTGPQASSMKAVRFHEFGKAEVLRVEDVPKPVAGHGEVLVRVHAAGVNPVDWKVRAGQLKALNPTLPQITGFDIAGVVESTGPEVERFELGDEVYAFLALERGGGYAEYALVPATELALKPKRLDFTRSAAVPLAALTAWQALFDNAGLSQGQTLLVHGAAGGVGHFAVQLAKAKGARVIATASERNHAFLKQLGADQVIDYTTQRFEELARDVDVVLDSIGGDTLERSYGVVKQGGFVVSIVARPDAAKLSARGLRGAVIRVKPDAKQLAQIAAWIDAGRLAPDVSAVLPLAEVRKAHELSEAGHTRGKLVLQVRP